MRTVWRAISSENNTDGGRYLGCVPTNLTSIPTVNRFRIPGALSIWLEKPARIFHQMEQYTGKGERKGIPRKALAFFPKTFHQDEPLHSNSTRNYRKFQSNGKRHCFPILTFELKYIHDVLTTFLIPAGNLYGAPFCLIQTQSMILSKWFRYWFQCK